jgi:hypothetical protein
VITALVLAIWSVAFVQRRGGGLVLILLSMALLLVGGLAPPLVGLILGHCWMHAVPPGISATGLDVQVIAKGARQSSISTAPYPLYAAPSA